MPENRTISTSGGNYIENLSGNYVQGNYYSNQQNLATAAAEIQELLQQLELTYSTNTTSEQMIVAAEAIRHIESNSKLRQKVVSAIREGGIAALEKAIDNPAGAFIAGAIEGWKEISPEKEETSRIE